MGSSNGQRGRILSFRDFKEGVRARPAEKLRVCITPAAPPADNLLDFLRCCLEDVQAVLTNDPAARHGVEVLLVYPGLHALWLHRVANALWRRERVLLPRLIAHLNRMLTGIEIHPGAHVGRRVFIDHGMGVVIGETAIVGDECLIYKGVVLGGTSLQPTRRHPTLGRGVIVGTNACILGAIQIGDCARIGSNSVVIRDVPAETTVVGVPARVAGSRSDEVREKLDHANLPDPVTGVIRDLISEVEKLRDEVNELRAARTRAEEGAEREAAD